MGPQPLSAPPTSNFCNKLLSRLLHKREPKIGKHASPLLSHGGMQVVYSSSLQMLCSGNGSSDKIREAMNAC